jgi:hypothetical protein
MYLVDDGETAAQDQDGNNLNYHSNNNGRKERSCSFFAVGICMVLIDDLIFRRLACPVPCEEEEKRRRGGWMHRRESNSHGSN